MEIKTLLNDYNFRDVWLMLREKYDDNQKLFVDYCLIKKEMKKLEEEIKERDNYYYEEFERTISGS
jgi:hypothetical protein